MKVFWAICKREWKSYFATPIAIVFLTVFLILCGFFTFRLGRIYETGQADLRAFFMWHPWLYLFIVPAVSMRLWAEERNTGTIELLLTLPVSLFKAMAGKFVAAWLFIGFALLLTTPVVFTVCYLGDPDLGVVIASYLGSFLMAGAFLAIGCCVSAMTRNQVIAFVVTTAVCLLFILLGFDPVIDTVRQFVGAGVSEQLSNLSIPYHFEAIQRGVLDLRDIVYFLSMIMFGLIAGAIVLARYKAE